jgi:hypothetical protein
MRTLVRVIVTVFAVGTGAAAGAPTAAPQEVPATLERAQRLFYSGEYEEAAALALAMREADRGNLAASEIRTSALHFAIKRALGPGDNRERAWKACSRCQHLLLEFLTELHLGRTEARARLSRTPNDAEALFFLGKLNLNYVWLQSGTLGRKTGWSEYWEARRSLDAALALDPGHVRARVAQAFMDYIVGTKVPRGVRWLLGGGNRKRGLQVVRDATLAAAPPYVQAEAMFALWDLQVRERDLADAVVTARALARDFPANRDLTKFLSTHDLQSSR